MQHIYIYQYGFKGRKKPWAELYLDNFFYNKVNKKRKDEKNISVVFNLFKQSVYLYLYYNFLELGHHTK